MSETIIKMTGGVIRQQKNTILKDVNIEIKSGEFVYLIGKVGSGKSSFLKTLYAELPLEFGNAEVVGYQLSKIKKSQKPLLRRKCGIVFQDFKLLIDRNVYDNLEFVLRATGWKNRKAIQERIETVLNKVDMLNKQHQMPHQLSGGEQQRIVLARALLNAPPLILADEPTGNIDPETSYHLVELLKEICDTGKTVIIATHQYDLIERYPGRVFCCENGTLFERNPVMESEEKIIFGAAQETPSNEFGSEALPSIDPNEEIFEQVLVEEVEGLISEEVAEQELADVNLSEIFVGEETEKVPVVVESLAIEADLFIEAGLQEMLVEEKQFSEEMLPVLEEVAKVEAEPKEEEDDILRLIGKLNYPLISSFDYELDHLPELMPENMEKEEEEIPQPEVAEKQLSVESETEQNTQEEPEKLIEKDQKKINSSFMDLELID